MRLFVLILFFLKGQIIFANEFPNLFGCLCEGGLITGKISKNDKISIDGIKIKILLIMANLFLHLVENIKAKL